MANGFSSQALSVLDGGNQLGDGGQVNADDRSSNVTLTGASLVAQGVGAIGDTIVLYDYPAGVIPSAIVFQTDTAFTGATLNFGDGVTANKYGSIAAPAANTRYILDAVAVRMAGILSAKSRLTITIAGAALPAVFNATVKMSYFGPAV